MINRRKILVTEYTVIILLWTLMIVAPLLFMDDFDQDRMAVHVMWAEYCVVGFAFVVNRFLLMPRLFFAQKYIHYAASLVILFTALSIFVLKFDGVNLILSIFGEVPIIPNMPSMGSAPMYGPPPHGGPSGDMPRMITVIPPTISVLIFSAIVIALDMGLSIAARWVIAEQKQAEINRENVITQLANLQDQVSPHFLMNTLNNIHALVDIDSARAKKTIIELSALMDYLLYESSGKGEVSLQRELDFISNYISLMRLRFPQNVKIEFTHSKTVPSIKIPPLLFLNFIENAFKYGVDYERDSFINIGFDLREDKIQMSVHNSNHASLVKPKRHGLGISNARKRLDLLYGSSYSLVVNQDQKSHYVNLTIPII